eukprot:TRINITY_DN6529_c0_g1_i1.p1 TRINITY_DN6529_c0_g1~~TRINITY_DN6529_c0_g1_i1.p1  ORF type:complete len:405 (-),score=49.70 TRINITY_DN6529_c0_g1_i1:85-1272(-)
MQNERFQCSYPLCKKILVNAITVPCGHNFCSSCAKRIEKENPTGLQCPKCGKAWCYGVSKPNIPLREEVQQYELSLHCKIHSDMKINIVCMQCNDVPICDQCRKHGDHKKHTTQDLAKYETETKELIVQKETECKALKLQFDKITEILKQIREDKDFSRKASKKIIESEFSILQKELDQMKNNMIARVDSVHQAEGNLIDEKQKTIDERKAQVISLQQKLNKKPSSLNDLISTKREALSTIHSVRTEDGFEKIARTQYYQNISPSQCKLTEHLRPFCVIIKTPMNLSSSYIMSDKFTIEWEYEDIEVPAIKFQIELKHGSNTEMVETDSVAPELKNAPRAKTLSNLMPETIYTVRVCALTQIGKSTWSDPLSVQTNTGHKRTSSISLFGFQRYMN